MNVNKLKIGYFGDGLWAQNSLNYLLKDKDIVISFICLRFDTQDPVLKKMAFINNIDCFFHNNVNSKDFLDKINKYNCDIFVSMSFNQIFKKDIIYLTPKRVINCHAGKLPFYRGRNILNWVLINDEKEFGITVHYIDEGIDTGDIILQKTYPITDDDDYRTLLEKASIECANVLYESICNIKNDKINLIKQKNIHPIGFYCGIRKDGDEIIDWNQTSREIFCFIRAVTKPGPMAKNIINDKEIRINKAKLIDHAPNYKHTVGQVVGKNCNNLILKTKDSTIEIIEYYYDGNIKIGDELL
jgi:methionyl-tRNA formyltransferase